MLDVTDRLAGEEALRESEHRHRLALDVAQLGTWEWDLRTGEGRLDKRGAEIVGVPEGPLADIAAAQATVIHPDDIEPVGVSVEAGIATGGTFDLRYRVVLPDGRIRYIDSRARALPDASGQPARLVGTNRDVTARHEAERSLRESEAHLRRVIDNMLGFVAVTDVNGSLLDVNQAALAVAGLTREDVIGQKLWDGYWWNYDSRISARIEDAVRRAAGGTTVRTDIEARIADGQRIVMDFMLVPVRAESGEVIYLIPSGMDITARKRAEESVRQLNETLEDRVEERTAQVRRLAAQLTVAEQKERERIAHVLHDDLQQQLYGLAMLLPLLQRASPDEAERLLSRAETILDEATFLARTLSTELSPSVLASDQLEDSLRWLAERKRQLYGLQVEVVMEVPCQVVDPATRTLLYQTLREVLFNVVKHAEVEHARLVVQQCDDDVVIRVEDDGRRLDASAAAGGFGLTNIRSRLELVGGRFEVETAPGRGTRVTLAVPTSAPRTLPEP